MLASEGWAFWRGFSKWHAHTLGSEVCGRSPSFCEKVSRNKIFVGRNGDMFGRSRITIDCAKNEGLDNSVTKIIAFLTISSRFCSLFIGINWEKCKVNIATACVPTLIFQCCNGECQLGDVMRKQRDVVLTLPKICYLYWICASLAYHHTWFVSSKI